jgi:hypothetical protein
MALAEPVLGDELEQRYQRCGGQDDVYENCHANLSR